MSSRSNGAVSTFDQYLEIRDQSSEPDHKHITDRSLEVLTRAQAVAEVENPMVQPANASHFLTFRRSASPHVSLGTGITRDSCNTLRNLRGTGSSRCITRQECWGIWEFVCSRVVGVEIPVHLGSKNARSQPKRGPVTWKEGTGKDDYNDLHHCFRPEITCPTCQIRFGVHPYFRTGSLVHVL